MVRRQSIDRHDRDVEWFIQAYQLTSANGFSSSFAYGRTRIEGHLEIALRRLPPGSSVLDVGCGTGRQLNTCRTLGLQVTGLEPAPRMRAIASELNPGTPVLDGIATALPFSDKSFDFVMGIEVLRYLHRDDVLQAYREMHRVLRPSGQLFLTLVNRYALDGFYVYDQIRRYLARIRQRDEPLHCEFTTAREVLQDLARTGMTDINVYGRALLPLVLFYRVNVRLGLFLAKCLHPIDDLLAKHRWAALVASHLIVTARKPAEIS